MHETAIAQSIVETVLKEAEKHNAESVESIEIVIGDLTFLGIEQIEFWVRTNFEDTVAQNAELIFKRVKGGLKCNKCGYEGDIQINEDPAYHFNLPLFACPVCKSSDIEITRGKESIIKSIKLVKD